MWHMATHTVSNQSALYFTVLIDPAANGRSGWQNNSQLIKLGILSVDLATNLNSKLFIVTEQNYTDMQALKRLEA